MLHRQVPDVRAAGMSLHAVPGGCFDLTTFHSGRVTMLAGDPKVGAATRPGRNDYACRVTVFADGTVTDGDDVTVDTGTDPLIRIDSVKGAVDVVADVGVLRRRLVSGLVDHMEPLVVALRARARLGPPALWGAVATQCGRAFLLTERMTGDPDIGRIEADAFFALARPPMRARPTWFQFTHRGRRQTAMRRGSCCLIHRMSAQYCTTCPFIPDSEHERRLHEWVDTQGDGGLAVG